MKTLFSHRRAILLFAVGLCLAAVGAYPFASWLSVPSRLERVRSDYKEIFNACAKLALDNCGLCFPDDNYLSRENPALPLTFDCRPVKTPQGPLPAPHRCLTTPVAYMNQIPRDPFNDGREYGYASFRASSKHMNFMGILSSPGPDGKTDLPLEELRERLYDYRDARHTPWRMSSADRGVIRQWIDPYLYDPTNGVRSRGDLLLVMETHRMRYGYGVPPDSKWMNTSLPEMMPLFQKKEITTPVARKNPEEEKNDWNNWKITPPANLAKVLYAAGVLMGDGQTFIGDVVVERIDLLRNHLGVFREFFDHPRAGLSQNQRRALEDWREHYPQWWQAMRDPASVPGRYINVSRIKLPSLGAYDLYPVIIFYGKSQLLQAADESRQNETHVAMRRIADLRDMLNNLGNSRELIKRDPNIERIHQELGRLCDELEANMTNSK